MKWTVAEVSFLIGTITEGLLLVPACWVAVLDWCPELPHAAIAIESVTAAVAQAFMRPPIEIVGSPRGV